jgi:hypothetical protein
LLTAETTAAEVEVAVDPGPVVSRALCVSTEFERPPGLHACPEETVEREPRSDAFAAVAAAVW